MNGMRMCLSVGVALLIACGSPSESNIGRSEDNDQRGDANARPGELVLAIGQEKVAAGTNLRVAFAGVRSDSRCPIDAICVHAGDAEVQITLTIGTSSTSHHVLHWNSGENRPRSATAGNYRVTLVMLDPMPSSSTGTPAPTAYRAHLKVENI